MAKNKSVPTPAPAPAEADNAVVPVQANGTHPAPASSPSSELAEYHAPQSIGEAYDEQIAGNIESDIRYSIASRNLQQARARMGKIKQDCETLVSEIEENYNDEEAGLAILFIESVRPELIRLYLTINSKVANTKEGQQKIAALADRLVDGYIKRLQKDGADPLPLLASAGEAK